MLEILLSLCQIWWGSDFTHRWCSQKRWSFLFVFLFVCLSVRHTYEWKSPFLHDGVGVQKQFWYRSCALVFTFFSLLPIANTAKCWSPKTGKIFGFSLPKGDNLANKRIPRVCYSTQNFALIGKRGSVQEPPKCKNLPKIVVFSHRKLTQWTHSYEIWRVSVDLGSALPHQFWL